jgi:hypothetical protein
LGAIRDRACRAAAATDEPTLQSEALWFALSDQTVVTVVLFKEGEAHRSVAFPVIRIADSDRCMSLGVSRGCGTDSRISVLAREVTLAFMGAGGEAAGHFSLAGDGRLAGSLTLREGSARAKYPAEFGLR